ncbi:MAG: hypothetical protein ABI345_07570 [Jatrophihabitans sp.]
MSKTSKDLAARLLDAQVEFIVGQLTGADLADLLEHDVDDLFTLGAELPLESVVSADAVKLVLHRVIDVAGDSALFTSAIDVVADAIYDLPTASEHKLGDVVARAHVDALIVKVLSMHRIQDKATSRMMQSPAVAAVSTKFVGSIVADLVGQNRDRVERLPGAKSIMKIGLGAASRVQQAAQDTFIGDAAGKSAQYAVKRTVAATREVIRDAPLREAALELWDLQAAEPMSDLRTAVTAANMRELVTIVRELLADARGSEYAGDLLDACVDAIFAEHGSTDVAALLVDARLGREEVLFGLQQLAPPLLSALRDTGALDTIIRDRLAPFYESKQLHKILDGAAAAPPKPKPTPR